MALEALGTRRAFGKADVYINDEKNSRVRVTSPPQSQSHRASRKSGVNKRTGGASSDLVIIRGTRLDPQSFPTVDKVPRRNKNYAENEQAMFMTYNRELEKF